MKPDELEGLNREQRFDALKGMCKSRADLNLCLGLLLLAFILLAVLTKLGYYGINGTDIIPFVEFSALGCLVALLALNNYRFHKRADSLSTPDQLLNKYEKTVKNNNKCWLAFVLLIACKDILTTDFNEKYFWLRWVILFILIAVAVVLYKKVLISQRDKEIINALRELTEEEQGN